MTTPAPHGARSARRTAGSPALRQLAGSYPAGHPMIGQKLKELERDRRAASHKQPDSHRCHPGDVFLDGVASSSEARRTNSCSLSCPRLASTAFTSWKASSATSCSPSPNSSGNTRSPASRCRHSSRRATFSTSVSADCCRSIRDGARRNGRMRRRGRSIPITPNR